MSPNVPGATPKGPTDDEYDNARIIGTRQFDAAHALATSTGTEVTGGLETRLRHVNLAGLAVDPSFTPDGRPRQTGHAVLGAAFAAGTKEGPGAGFCHEGVDADPAMFALSRALYRLRPRIGDAQHPKTMLIPCGMLGWTAEIPPMQLVRIGPLVLIAVAQEVAIVAGLRLRRAVAEVLGTTIDNVLVQGYANDYAGYLTTPEEYAAQRYEGGHTMFGRWQLPAYLQEVTRLAIAMRDGAAVDAGTAPPLAKPAKPGRVRAPKAKSMPTTALADSYPAGATATATINVPDPRGPVRPSYLSVETHGDNGWARVATDGDWATRIEWHYSDDVWTATMTWHIPTRHRRRRLPDVLRRAGSRRVRRSHPRLSRPQQGLHQRRVGEQRAHGVPRA